jgi:hypothetical protein
MHCTNLQLCIGARVRDAFRLLGAGITQLTLVVAQCVLTLFFFSVFMATKMTDIEDRATVAAVRQKNISVAPRKPTDIAAHVRR